MRSIARLSSIGRLGSGLGTGGGSPPVTVVAVDPPIYGSSVAKTRMAFGENRLVEGYSGNTITLKRLSDNATQAFGFDAQGRHDKAAALAWGGGADIDVVHRICQKGSGFLQVAVGTIAYSRGGVYCFGTDKSLTTSALTRNSLGSVGARMTGGGHFVVSATTLSKTAGDLEFHFMFSQDARKKGSGNTGDPGNNTQEHLFTYGRASDRRVYMQFGGGTGALTSRFQTSSTNTTNSTATPGTGGNYVIPANALSIITVRLGATSWEAYAEGRRFLSSAYTANQITDLAGTPLDGGTIVTGSNFGSTSNDSQLTTARPVGIDGGLIVTDGLTDAERFFLHLRWKQVARHDLVESYADTTARWKEIFVHKDVNVSTGLLLGRKGQAALQYDITRPGNTWDLAYVTPQVGLKGIRNPTLGSTGNFNNRWAATSNFFTGVINGTALTFGISEHTGNSLHYFFAREDQSFITATNGLSARGNLAMGFDHQGAGVVTKWGYAKDTENLFLGRQRVNAGSPTGFSEWGSTVYEGMGTAINQPNGKYNPNTVHVFFQNSGETITESGTTYTLTAQWWQTGADPSITVAPFPPPYALDAPIFPNTPENLTATSKHSMPLLHIATFKAPVGYNPADSYAVNKPKRLQGEVRSFITSGGVPIGHRDGSVAINYNAGVADGGANDYLQSCFFQGAFHGTSLLLFLTDDPVSDVGIQKTDVNLYKILEAAA